MPVYFIRAGEGGPVKIGTAIDVRARFSTLQTGHYERLTLIRQVEGAEAQERWLHAQFDTLRIRGEWFRFDPAMLTIQPPHIVQDAVAYNREPVGRKDRTGAFVDVIRLWPNRAEFARAINVPYVTAQQMELRNSIGINHWKAVVAGAAVIGHPEVDLQFLMRAYRQSRAEATYALDRAPMAG
jgi:hypothetical protein